MNNEMFESLVVVELSSSTPQQTKDWLIKRLTDSQEQDDGADLLVRYDSDPESHNDILLIGASLQRLLAGAEELRIKKPSKNRVLREFLVSDLNGFDNSENLNNFLSKAEKQRIIWEEMQNLRPMDDEHTVPGVPSKGITPSHDTILEILRNLNFLVNVFPLHDKEEIKLIERDWFMSKNSFLKSQDLNKVRNYFGENVAFYFAFVEFYTKALIPTSILGFLVTFWPSSDFFKYSTFCLFNVIWWSVFMERWKRFSNKLAFQWGSYDSTMFERPRAVYHGVLKRSEITGKLERQYSTWKRMLRKYFVTYPLVFVCFAISIWIYFYYYRIQKKIDENYPLNSSVMLIQAKYIRLVPSAVYSLAIIPLNSIYTKFATILTDFENHRLQTAYENNLTTKLFLVYFINCFVGLFYEAFFNANYGNVANLLVTFVVFNAILLKFTEQIGPYIFKRLKKKRLIRRGSQDVKLTDAVKQARTLTHFDGTYADYLTIFEQFGYVSLFSAVFPWVTICALINNIFELRADAFKYCYVYQRPFALPVRNIGSWHHAFDVLSSVSIVTNTALIAMLPSVREYFSSYNTAEYILLFVAAEHILLALKFIIDFAIPDVPADVQVAKAKILYESNQALRRERLRKAEKASMATKM